MKRVGLLLVVSCLAFVGCTKKDEEKPCSSEVTEAYNRVLWSELGSQEEAEAEKEFKAAIGGQSCVAFSIFRGKFVVTAGSTEVLKTEKIADKEKENRDKEKETEQTPEVSYFEPQSIIEKTLIEAPAKKTSVTCVVFDSNKEQQTFQKRDVLSKSGENLVLEESSVNGTVQVIAHNQVPSIEIRIAPRVPKYSRSVISATYDILSKEFQFKIGDYSNANNDKDYFGLACYPMQGCFQKSMVLNHHNGTVEVVDEQFYSTEGSTKIDNSRFKGSFSRSQIESNLDVTQYTTDRNTSVKITEGERTQFQVVTREGKAFKGVACTVN